jgi:hypothetical protein
MNIAFIDYKVAFPETVQFGGFVENAQRLQKISFSFEKSGLTRVGGVSLF